MNKSNEKEGVNSHKMNFGAFILFQERSFIFSLLGLCLRQLHPKYNCVTIMCKPGSPCSFFSGLHDNFCVAVLCNKHYWLALLTVKRGLYTPELH